MPEACESLETLVWQPDAIMDGDLLMYLRAARSMAAFVGWCDGGSTDDGCAAASMDETTINSLHMLHQHTYDTGKALQALVKIINPKSVDKRWSDDDAKKFVRGLKQHGKNFFKIRKDLLPNKETPQLVEYYYLWKKTPAASTTRPHRRHRRPVRRQATPTLPSSEYAEEMSSGSEGSGNESYEETDQSTVPGYRCHQCLSAKSDHWHGSGKDRMFCSDCFSFLPKYDDDPVADETTEPPPFMFRPVKEETAWKHSIPELEKLGPEGKDGLRCPETSDEGRQEERASPSTGSTYSSRSSPTKDVVAPASEPEGVAPSVHPSIVAPKCYAETHPDNGAPKARTGSPSDSASDGSSIYAAENEEHESDADNNPDEGSSGPCSNTPSPAEHYSKASGCIATKADNSVGANEEWRHSELQALPKELETVEDKGRCKMSTYSSDPNSSVPSCGWLGLSVAEGKAPADVVVKEEPNYEVESICSAIKIKKEALSDDHDDCDPVKRVQLPLHGQAPWAEGKSRDDVKPQRAVASVAPTQFAKLEASEAMQVGGRTSPPHFPPPPLALLSAASPLKVAAAPEAPRNDGATPSLRMSPTATAPHACEISYKSQAGFVPGPPSKVREHYLEDRRRSQSPVLLLHRDRSRSRSRSRSQSPAQDSDFEPDVRRSPSPEPRRINKECYRSERSIIVKRWFRGYNTCSRCDFEFVPPPGSKLAQKREERLMKACHGGSGGKFHHGPGSSISKETRKAELRKEEEKKKPNTPPENRTSDALITSSLMATHHMSPYVPERLTPRGQYPVGHDPTPALSQLSAYARPHIGSAAAARDLQRCMPPFPLSSFPPQSMDPYFRMPGVYPPGSREVIEMEIEREREREREMRDLEFMEKLKQDMELKPPGFDRLPPHLSGGPAGAVDPIWAELHRRNMVLPGGPPGHLANIYPGNLTDLSLIQRERERNAEIARLTQEHQLAAAARDSSALQQLYQRYSHDPAVLQRHLSTYLASKAHETEVARLMEASHLVYHFARADPLATAGPAAAQGAPSGLPPHLPPTHAMGPGHPLLMAAREQERMYLELINRPPYNTDPIMAQQLSVQMAHTHEVIRQMERDCMGPGSLMLH